MNKPTPRDIKAAWNAATVYTESGRAMTPDPRKIASHFKVKTKTVLKSINQ